MSASIITLDAETFYSKDFSLSKMSTEAYVRDRQFEIIGMAVKVDDNETQWFSGTLLDTIKWLRQFDWAGSFVLAQNCLTGDHEVRTPSGWVRLDQLKDGTPVLQWNPDTNESEFVVPSHVIRKPYKGEMLEWDSQFHKGVYTPDHRMYIQTPRNGQWSVATAAEVAQMGANHVYVPMAGRYQPQVAVPVDPVQVRLLEATRADGHIPRMGRQIRFRLTKKRKVERIKALCDTLGVTYNVKVDKHGVTGITLNAHPTVELVRTLLGAGTDKGLQSWVVDLPQATKEAWCDELKYWDGYGDRNTASNKQTTVHTAKREDAYWLYEMAVMAGRCAKVTFDIPNRRGWSAENSVLHMVSVRTKTKVKTLYPPQTVDFDGTVYCVSVPTGAFVVRRKGAVWATGNCIFDAAIHQWVCMQDAPKAWLDTMSMSRAIDGVHVSASLKELAKRWTPGWDKGTEVLNAIGKRRADFTAEELETYGQYCINDVELTSEIFRRMMTAGFPLQELKVIDRTIQMFVRPRLRLDAELLTDHLAEVRQRKADLLAQSAAEKEELMSNEKFADMLRAVGVEPPTKVSPTTGKTTYAFAKTDEGLKALLEHEDERVQALVAARLGVKSTLEETRTERLIAAAARGMLPIPLHYYGALTGRWSGADGSNWQNIPRGSRIKAAVKPLEGQKLIGADLSNIELRVGMWLSGQMDKVQMFRDKRDLYKEFATKVFGVGYDEVTKEQRQVSKSAVLSLLFGTGAKKLRDSIKTQAGTDIGEAEAKRIVDLYRADNPYLVAAWGYGAQTLDAIKHGEEIQWGTNQVIKADSRGILLPSGLRIQYPDLSVEQGEKGLQWSYKTRKGPDRIYGAKVFQQCVQSLARCIMAEMLVKSKYQPVLTVHDALYYVALEGAAEDTMEYVLQLFRTSPSWAQDLPLDAEASIGDSLLEV